MRRASVGLCRYASVSVHILTLAHLRVEPQFNAVHGL